MKPKIPDTLDSAVIQHFLKHRFEGVLDELAISNFKLPMRATKSRILAFHGFSGHSRQADMKHLGNSLRAAWHFFSAIDLPNHGQSVAPNEEEMRGKIPSMIPLVRAVHAATYKALSLKSDRPLPLYLMGYSAGAIALLTFLQRFPSVQKYIAGVVIIGGAFEVDQNARTWLLEHPHLARVIDVFESKSGLSHVLDYSLDLVSRCYPDVLISELSERYPDDVLEHKKAVDLRTATVLHLAAKRARNNMHLITVPILFLHGAKDPVAGVNAAIQAFEDCGTPPDKKQKKIYENGDHHIIAQAVPDILEWVEREHKRATYERIVYQEGLIKDMVKISSVFFVLLSSWLAELQHALVQLFTIFRAMLARWLDKLMFWK